MPDTAIFNLQSGTQAKTRLVDVIGRDAAAAAAVPGCDAVVVTGGGSGRCTLWHGGAEDPRPRVHGRRAGFIGRFDADDRAVALAVLGAALNALKHAGCELAIGPLDGSTWNSYRLITERGFEPPFFLEPQHPESWPEWWTAVGFTPLAGYASVLVEDLHRQDPRLAAVRRRLRNLGVAFRSFDPGRFEEELTAVHRLSLAAFSENFLYTPSGLEEFFAMYEPLRSSLDPRFVELAHDAAGALCGFLFAIPDMLELRRGGSVRTMILKTVATQRERRYAGLGNVLVANAHAAASQAGFVRAIHALMHEKNDSLNLSRRYGRVIRRYTLFQCPTGS